MVEYVNENGVIRSFGSMVMTGITGSKINIAQSLRSQTNDNVVTEEMRFATVDIVANEDPQKTVDKINEDGTSVIDHKGELKSIVLAG